MSMNCDMNNSNVLTEQHYDLIIIDVENPGWY